MTVPYPKEHRSEHAQSSYTLQFAILPVCRLLHACLHSASSLSIVVKSLYSPLAPPLHTCSTSSHLTADSSNYNHLQWSIHHAAQRVAVQAAAPGSEHCLPCVTTAAHRISYQWGVSCRCQLEEVRVIASICRDYIETMEQNGPCLAHGQCTESSDLRPSTVASGHSSLVPLCAICSMCSSICMRLSSSPICTELATHQSLCMSLGTSQLIEAK